MLLLFLWLYQIWWREWGHPFRVGPFLFLGGRFKSLNIFSTIKVHRSQRMKAVRPPARLACRGEAHQSEDGSFSGLSWQGFFLCCLYPLTGNVDILVGTLDTGIIVKFPAKWVWFLSNSVPQIKKYVAFFANQRLFY